MAATTEWVYPSQIRFIQDTIGCTFQDGDDVNDVAEELCDGDIEVEDFPTIEIVHINGKRYTFANRRLYVFRVAQFRGAIGQIPVKIVPSKKLRPSKFTTQNDGREVEVRGDETLRHYRSRWLRNDGDGPSGLADVMCAFGKMGISDSEDSDESDSDDDYESDSSEEESDDGYGYGGYGYDHGYGGYGYDHGYSGYGYDHGYGYGYY